jgi:hypothetical protein
MPSKEQMDFESCVSGAASKILLCRFAWPYDGGGSLLAAITRSSLRRSRCQAHHCGALVGPLASVAKVAALAVGNCIVQKTPRLQRPIERAAIRGPSALAGCASPSRMGRTALFVRFRVTWRCMPDRLASRAGDISNRSRMAIPAEAGCSCYSAMPRSTSNT